MADRQRVQHGSRLERAWDALYARHKPRYLHLVLIGTCVTVCLLAIPLWAAIDSRPPTRHVADPWMIGIETLLGIVVGIPVIWLVFLVRHRTLVRWLAGKPGADPFAAWTSVVRMPGSVAIVLAIFWLTISVPVHIVAARASSLHTPGLIVSCITSGFVLLGVGVFLVLMLERAMIPVAKDAARHAPPEAGQPHGWLDLRRRLIVVTGAIAIFTGAAVGSLTVGHGSHREEELMHMFVASCVAAVTITLALTLMLRRSLLSRLDEIRSALDGVRAGRLDLSLTPTNGDELDEVGAAFNDMVGRLASYEADMRATRARLVSAASDERRRIERDLHDGVQQYLALLGLQLSNIQRQADPVKASALADEARQTLNDASAELRAIAHGIYPVVLEHSGLEPALTVAAGRSTIRTRVAVENIGRMARECENAVYYCCLEALQNANKHAGQAATATISLWLNGEHLEFSIADDGVGFTPGSSSGRGLTNMRDRIGVFGGDVAVVSAPGAGTRVEGRVPLAGAVVG